MRYIKIFLLVFAITFLGLLALDAQEGRLILGTTQGNHKVMIGDSVISYHSKYIKAVSRMHTEIAKLNDDSVYVDSPNTYGLVSLEPCAECVETKAEIVSIRYESEKRWILAKPIPDLGIGNGCDSLAKTVVMVSKEDFDFEDVPVNLNNVSWTIEQRFMNNGEDISVIQALAKELIVMNCPQDEVRITYSWSDNNDGSYTYNGLINNQYIIFPACELAETPEEYELSFNTTALSLDNPYFALTLQSEDGIIQVIDTGKTYQDGAHKFYLNINSVDMNLIKVTALNDTGGAFTIGNLLLTKQ